MKSFRKYLVWFFLLFLACDSLFSTREPESPKNPQSSWKPPLSPEQVLPNLQSAIFERNLENYVRCLVDPSFSDRIFYFNPDPEVNANYAEVFNSWNRDKERTVMQQAFSIVPTDSVSYVQFTDETWEIVVPDSAVLVSQYRLELHHTQSTLPSVYKGHVTLSLASDRRGEWSIYRWIDNGVSGFSSWSLLKASLGG